MQSTGTCGPNADKIWLYEWNAAGHLSRVVRPDGQSVEFQYDALGRRVAKTFAGRTTRWVWDGNLPLHEWQEETGILLDVEPPPAYEMDARLAEVLQLLRDKTLSPLSPQGPPQRPSAEQPITWLFEPDSFAPLARLQGERRESIVCDHLGTPLAMFNDAGDQTWSLDLDIYGQPRMVEGERTLCPFRYPGQYEDAETGLYYNRFRYFDPEAGGYISQDPIGLAGGNPTLYGYVVDPGWHFDPLGLLVFLNPNDINFSQRTTSSNTSDGISLKAMTEDMRNNGYDLKKGKPINVMLVDGQYVSYDNRRLVAAQNAGLPLIPVNIVDPQAPHPDTPNRTWAQRFEERRNDPRNLDDNGVPVPRTGLRQQPTPRPKRCKGKK